MYVFKFRGWKCHNLMPIKKYLYPHSYQHDISFWKPPLNPNPGHAPRPIVCDAGPAYPQHWVTVYTMIKVPLETNTRCLVVISLLELDTRSEMKPEINNAVIIPIVKQIFDARAKEGP